MNQEEEKNKSASALREEEILSFWQENKIFEKSLEKESKEGEYIFYEGPPTANGKPGLHHLEARAFKDAVLRYKTMKGYHVARKGGWDTHGLPVEIEAEKKLGLKSKKEIESYGIDHFNEECKKSVWGYIDLWHEFTDRIGFWVDQKNPYVTYHNKYIESVWNVIKQAEKQNLLYKDYKIVPWCPRCGTGLSSHELALGYQDVKDITVYVKFKIDNKTSILVWTTTPWTLPSNVALAVGKEIDYVKIKQNDNFLILAKSRLSILDGEYELVEEMRGEDLVGLKYEPLYPYTKKLINKEEETKIENAYKIYEASFVTTEDGAGVVHIAPMYGQDDFDLGNKVGLPKYHLVGLDGRFIDGTDFLANRFVRDEGLAVDIIKELASRDLLYKKEKQEHSYPHCWRCKTALIYYARESWYIKMSELKDKMLAENNDINWEPSYIKEGRFGEWLKEIKDWAISRERYWGTPLPVWSCPSCGKKAVVGSLAELKERTKKSDNRYFIMRHGQAENNISDKVLGDDQNQPLTDVGRKQIKESLEKKPLEKIDIVISSPYLRTKETAEIVCREINYPLDKIIYDKRIGEARISSQFEGQDKTDFKQFYDYDFIDRPFDSNGDGESFSDLVKRVGDFIYDIDSNYQNKNILIVGHHCATKALNFIAQGLSFEETSSQDDTLGFLQNAEVKEFDFKPLPHNSNYELDLHRPYIDEYPLYCQCGERLERTKEVMDVWLDSGGMPFAQEHYPFSKKDIAYPADFISEAIDQTRGWFYTLHAVGNIMGRGKAFKNVICLGLLLDANGKKMSKSLGNVVDPWIMMDKYGVDSLRLWMYSVNQPGEPKNFDEKYVSEINNKFFNLLYNVLAFYELYRNKEDENNQLPKSTNPLDNWILSRLSELTEMVTTSVENYKLMEPVRLMRTFIDDLSTWYLRRSRDRIKEGNQEAKKTLYFTLKNLVKLMAPFAPFASEDIWQKLKIEGVDEESIHLSSWPKLNLFEGNIIKEMAEVREVVTLGLQSRQKASIPVRQPLSEIVVKKYKFKQDYIDIIKEELNIKDVKFDDGNELDVILKTEINSELKEEGNYRELVRAIQDIRKKNNLNPNDQITLEIETTEDGQKLIDKFRDTLEKMVVAKEIIFKQNGGQEIKIDQYTFLINLLVS